MKFLNAIRTVVRFPAATSPSVAILCSSSISISCRSSKTTSIAVNLMALRWQACPLGSGSFVSIHSIRVASRAEPTARPSVVNLNESNRNWPRGNVYGKCITCQLVNVFLGCCRRRRRSAQCSAVYRSALSRHARTHARTRRSVLRVTN